MTAPGLADSTPVSGSPPRLAARTVRVLFINDTARNGGPGRSLHSILKFLDPRVVHRAVVLPRDGAIAELLRRDGVADELIFEPNLVENPIEPWARPMERRDFDASAARKALRLAGNAVKATRAVARLSSLVRRGRFDLVYCNGTNADFAGGLLTRITGVPALWHVRYTSIPPAVAALHRGLSAGAGVRRIVCVSRSAAALFPHCPDKVAVIHNALDVADFDPARVRGTLRAELGLARDAIVFGSHGRVLRRKGYIEMVRAARLALDAMSPEQRARAVFVVVGDTPGGLPPRPRRGVSSARGVAGAGGSIPDAGFPGRRSPPRGRLRRRGGAERLRRSAASRGHRVDGDGQAGRGVRGRRGRRDARRRRPASSWRSSPPVGRRTGREPGRRRAPRRTPSSGTPRDPALRARQGASGRERVLARLRRPRACAAHPARDRRSPRASSPRQWRRLSDERHGAASPGGRASTLQRVGGPGRRCERAAPGRRAAARALRPRRDLVLRAPGSRQSAHGSARAPPQGQSRAQGVRAPARTRRRWGDAHRGRRVARQGANERFVDDLAHRLHAMAAEQKSRGEPSLVSYVESGTKDVHEFFKNNKWLYADEKDLESAYDTLDFQIAVRSGLVTDLGDDDPPAATRRARRAGAGGRRRRSGQGQEARARPRRVSRPLEGQGARARRLSERILRDGGRNDDRAPHRLVHDGDGRRGGRHAARSASIAWCTTWRRPRTSPR